MKIKKEVEGHAQICVLYRPLQQPLGANKGWNWIKLMWMAVIPSKDIIWIYGHVGFILAFAVIAVYTH